MEVDHDHSHAVPPEADRGKLIIALALILALMAAEVAVGIVADSLALRWWRCAWPSARRPES